VRRTEPSFAGDSGVINQGMRITLVTGNEKDFNQSGVKVRQPFKR
jgi:hypothetical protein